MSCNTQTRNLGPRNILLGKDTYQEFCFYTKADSAGSLMNKYFVIHFSFSYNLFHIATA